MRALGLLRPSSLSFYLFLSLPPDILSFALEQYDEIERDTQIYRGRW